jgi:DnaK suppressor protein
MTLDNDLPPDYSPREDEDYMCPRHLAFFRGRLLQWRSELLAESQRTRAALRDDAQLEVGDEADRASREEIQALELRTRERYLRLLGKIDAALGRIEDGSYGFCEETGEPIGLARLLARPIATLSLEAQERHERRERLGIQGS